MSCRHPGVDRPVLDSVKDPEVPVLSVVELGVVRAAEVEGDRVTVTITPTYSGCPALDVMEREIRAALVGGGVRRGGGEDGVRAGLDHRLDSRGRAGETAGLRHRAAGTGWA